MIPGNKFCCLCEYLRVLQYKLLGFEDAGFALPDRLRYVLAQLD